MFSDVLPYEDFLATLDVDAFRCWTAIQTASVERKPSVLLSVSLSKSRLEACRVGTLVEPSEVISAGTGDEIKEETGAYGSVVEGSQAVVYAEELAFVVRMSVSKSQIIAVRNHHVAS